MLPRSVIFETKSGVFHVVDNRAFTSVVEGVNTGDVYVAKGVSPYTTTGKKDGVAGVESYTDKIVYRPIAEGQSFRFNTNCKVTIGADGEPIVMFMEFAADKASTRLCCIGPGK